MPGSRVHCESVRPPGDGYRRGKTKRRFRAVEAELECVICPTVKETLNTTLKNLPPIVVELPSDELGGASGARYFHVLAVGKANTPEYPYNVANEKIASEIGRALGLPIPEVVLYRLAGEWTAFSCFVEQTESSETAPSGTASQIQAYYREHPEELHGMICFDLFIGNNDRKTDNLVLGEDGIVRLIDHANSLFYRPTGSTQAGVARLKAIQDDLSAMFDKPHWFLGALESWERVDEWCQRMGSLPPYFIECIVNNLPSGILSGLERHRAIEFLTTRKDRMQGIIENNLSLFPALKKRGG